MILIRELVVHSIGGGWGADAPEEGADRVAIIRGADFPDVAIGDVSTVPIRWESLRKLPQRTLQAGDIILESSGGTSERPTGRSVYISQRLLDQFDTPVIPASFCRLLRIDPERADAHYVYWWLQGMYADGRTWGYQNRSTGIANFQFEHFLDTEAIRLPDRAEQRAIAATLGTLDDKIESNRRLAERTSELIDALASALLARTSTEVLPLGDLVEFNRLTVKPHSTDIVRYIDIASVSPGQINSVQELTWDKAPSRARRGVSDGDVIYSTVRPGNRSFALIVDPAPGSVASTGFAVISPSVRLGSSMLTSMIGTPEFAEYLDSVAHGSAYPAVSIQAMARYPVVVPKDAVISEQFEADTMPLRRRVAQARAESDRLTALRDALLPELLSGRISVPAEEGTT